MNTPAPDARRRPRLRLFAGVLILLTLILVCLTFSITRSACRASPKTEDLANIRSLDQAALIYANDHHDQLPLATSLWDYAHQLVSAGILSDETIWHSRLDPADDFAHPLAADFFLLPQSPENALRFKPSVAVPLGRLEATMPATTPIVWTRGLRPDGTWSPSSPYGTSGGYIAFMGGNVKFYPALTADGGQLTRFDGHGKTANILDALPPGTRIGEYTPTPEEATAWSRAIARQHRLSTLDKYGSLLFPLLLLSLPVLPFILYHPKKTLGRALRLLIAFVLLLPLLATLLASSIC